MAGVPQSTLTWLYDVLNQLNYRNPMRAYSDLAQTIAQYPSLPPRSAVYTSENGSSALLVNLKGTLPVNFRGIVYQFPLTIWLPQAYPFEAPMVYITPTEEMIVRQGQHVSGADGRVYHQYLANWGPHPDRFNTIELLRTLTDVFSREAPVMARPKNAGPQRPPREMPPSTPQPYQQQQDHRRPGSGQYGGGGAPPPPPKQHSGHPRRVDSISSPPPPAPKPGRYDAPPPLPSQTPSPMNSRMSQPIPSQMPPSMTSQMPPQMPSQSPQPQSMYANGHMQPPRGIDNQMVQRPDFQQTGQPQQQYRPQQGPGSISSPPPFPPQGQSQMPYQQQTHQQPQPQPQPQPSQYQAHNNPPQQHMPQPGPQTQTQQFQQKQPQRDLLSEEDPFQVSLPTTQAIPAPSIPPNPEKKALLSHISQQLITRLHNSIDQTNNTAIPSLQAQNSALAQAQANLNSEINQLQTLSSHLLSNIKSLKETLNEANSTIASTRDPKHPSNVSNIPSIHEIIIPPSVIARQLYDNVAEQRGYESAIYALNEAFVRGRVSSEIWSRKVRECAREEFRRKWMVRRIATGLGLEGLPS